MKKIHIACTFLFLFCLNSFAGSRSNNNLSLVLSAAATVSNVTCNGGCNGSATITANGISPYSYQWIPSGPSSNIGNGLCPGSYTVVVTDASSATVAVVFTITQPPPLSLSSSASSTICAGSCKTLTTSASGGTSPYTYNWQPGNLNGSSITVCPTVATTYTAIAYDNNFCPIANLVNVGITNTVANAGPTQSITCVNPTAVLNGSGLSTYNWSGPGIISGALTPSPTVSSPGVYSLTGTSNGCASNTATVMVVMNTAAPNVIIGASSNTVCAGNTVTLIANSSPNTVYNWTNGSNTPSTVVSPTNSSVYTVTVTNVSNGCYSTASQGVGVMQLPNVTASSPSNVCDGTTACLTASGATTYTWTGPCGFTSTQASPCFPFSIACACTYSVKGATANGCAKTTTICLNVIAPPPISLMTTDTIICSGQSTTLSVSGANSYTWSTGSTATVIVVSPTVNTSYSLTASNGNGCPAMAYYTQSVTTCTGIKGVTTNKSELIIYPNPTAGKLIINVSAPSDVTIYNVTGKELLVDKLKSGANSIDMSNLPKGIYFVKCGGLVRRVVKE